MPKEKTSQSTILYDLAERNREKLIKNATNSEKIIFQHLSRNSEALSVKGPTRRFSFNENDDNRFFEACGITKEEIKQTLKECKYIESTWKWANDPFIILASILIFFYYKNRNEIKNKEYYKTISLYLTLKFYGIIQVRQFKYNPNEAVMEYTIDNLSNRFLIKKANNVYDMLRYISESNLENMKEETLDKYKIPTDETIIKLANNLKNRISSTMINITDEFIKNNNKNLKVLVESHELVGSDGETFLNTQMTNISSEINTSVTKIIKKFYSSSNLVDSKLLRLAVSKTDLSYSKMKYIIEFIRQNSYKEVEELISTIIIYYLVDENKKINNIKSEDFAVKSIEKVISVSNTKNEYVIKIKNCLDAILSKSSEEYLKTSRVATISNMRKCLYIYFVLFIMKNIE